MTEVGKAICWMISLNELGGGRGARSNHPPTEIRRLICSTTEPQRSLEVANRQQVADEPLPVDPVVQEQPRWLHTHGEVCLRAEVEGDLVGGAGGSHGQGSGPAGLDRAVQMAAERSEERRVGEE